jgi:acetyltransferase
VFGPVIVFGRGGIAVEVFKDTQAGLPPLNMALAQHLVEGTRMYPLLKGYRGQPGGNLSELNYILCKFAYLVMDFPQIVEIEINPLLADAKGNLVVDATVLLEDVVEDLSGPDYRHLVISPYPGKKYSKTLTLKTGEVITLRPVRPEDEPALARMLQGVSDDSLYMRFFGYIPQITHAWLIRFTHIDYDREMAIVAEISRGASRELVGSVRIIEDTWRETAEYSILIADQFQGRGLGNLMTDYIIDIARDRKINKIVASVLSQNTAMIKLFEKWGFKFDKSDLEVYEVELEL